MEWRNEEFDLGGVNHLALVCSDMKRTVEFYTQVLGMRLIKTLDLPGGAGQHFFFDSGGGNALAFFWFPGRSRPGTGRLRSGDRAGNGGVDQRGRLDEPCGVQCARRAVS